MSTASTVATLQLINTLLPTAVTLVSTLVEATKDYTSEDVPSLDKLKELQERLNALEDF